MKKRIGMIGLGKMGANLALHLLEQKWEVVGFNRTHSVAENMSHDGLEPASSIQDLVKALPTPRVVWVMVPAGAAVDDMLFGETGLAHYLEAGDIVIDGGNSLYKDAGPRAAKLKDKGIHYLDVGTSGGPGGARHGACLMIGGEEKIFRQIELLFKDAALENGYQFFAGHGAGHFVKMVHNGIEYGMMQAIAEGFNVLKTSDYHLDLTRVTNLYNHGSVIESRLIGWLENAFKEYGEDLNGVSGSVAHTGEGAWTVQAAKDMGLEIANIEQSLQFRIDSDAHPSYTGQVLSALRGQFGGHSIKGKKTE